MKKLTKTERTAAANKFKNVLAQPLPTYWPEIADTERDELHSLLSELFSDTSSKADIKSKSVHLGLSASIREVQNNRISCLLLSADIKPKFVVNQIINLILAKQRETTPLIVPNLECLVETHFGIKSTAVSIRKNSLPSIEEWIKHTAKLYPVPLILEQYYKPKDKKRDASECPPVVTKKDDNKPIEIIKTEIVKSLEDSHEILPTKTLKKQEKPDKTWGEFISFSNKVEHTAMDVDIEEDKSILLNTIKKFTKPTSVNPVDSGQVSKSIKIKKTKHIHKNTDRSESAEITYLPLKINKIQKNPDKVKKKRKIKKDKLKMQ